MVHESVASLHDEMNAAAKSHVNGLLSGSLVHVAISGRLLAEQLIGVPAWQSSKASQNSWPLQNRVSSQKVLLTEWMMISFSSSHVSTVQFTLSVKDGGVPAKHVAFRHVSLPLQNNPSLQSCRAVVSIVQL